MTLKIRNSHSNGSKLESVKILKVWKLLKNSKHPLIRRDFVRLVITNPKRYLELLKKMELIEEVKVYVPIIKTGGRNQWIGYITKRKNE